MLRENQETRRKQIKESMSAVIVAEPAIALFLPFFEVHSSSGSHQFDQ